MVGGGDVVGDEVGEVIVEGVGDGVDVDSLELVVFGEGGIDFGSITKKDDGASVEDGKVPKAVGGIFLRFERGNPIKGLVVDCVEMGGGVFLNGVDAQDVSGGTGGK